MTALTKESFNATLSNCRPQIEAFLQPLGISVDRFMLIARTCVSKNPKLLECESGSIFGAIYHACELGLEPNTAHHYGSIIPYNANLGTKEKPQWAKLAQFQIEYQGVQELMYRTDLVNIIDCFIVYEGDKFLIRYGSNKSIEHEPTGLTNYDKAIGCYAIAKLSNGSEHFVYLTKEQIMKAKEVSKTKWGGFEKNDFAYNMWKKTVIKQLYKQLPKGKKSDSAVKSIDIENKGIIPIMEISQEGVRVSEDLVIDNEDKQDDKPLI